MHGQVQVLADTGQIPHRGDQALAGMPGMRARETDPFDPGNGIDLGGAGASTGTVIVFAVSPGEVYLALRAGFAPESIWFTCSNVSDEDLRSIKTLADLERHATRASLGVATPRRRATRGLSPMAAAGRRI